METKDGDALFGARSAVAYQSVSIENNDVNTPRMDAEPRGTAQIQFGSASVVDDPPQTAEGCLDWQPEGRL